MSEFLTGTGLAAGNPALWLIAKITCVLVMGLVAMRLAHTARAAVRHFILLATFVAIAGVPVLTPLLPAISLEVPTVANSVFNSGEPGSSGEPDALVSFGEALTESAWMPMTVSDIWYVGTAFFLLPIGAALFQMTRSRRRAHQWPAVAAKSQELARHVGVRQIDVRLADGLAGPIAFGFPRATVLLPREAVSWSERDLERALTHELAHLRRHDWAVQMFARCVCALYWFHPLVWVCWRQIRLEAEQACDDVVLQYSEPADYAGQLVALAHRMRGASLLAMAGRRDLSTRVAAILEERRSRGPAGWRMRVPLASAACLLAVSMASLHVEAVNQVRAVSDSPRFNDVTIRRNESREVMMLQPLPGGRLRIVNAPLRVLIRAAYGIQDHAIIGAPDWTERFDIVASANRDVTLNEMPRLLRGLLEERFKLRVRSETREMPVFALRSLPGGHGAGLRPSSTECAAARASVPAAPATTTTVMNPCGFHVSPGKLVATGVTLRALASSLSNYVGHPVLDQTNSTDDFDLDLSWASDQMPAGDSIAAAIQEQLGLRLEPVRAGVDVLVVESAERPVEN